jgi:hypothetical protein
MDGPEPRPGPETRRERRKTLPQAVFFKRARLQGLFFGWPFSWFFYYTIAWLGRNIQEKEKKEKKMKRNEKKPRRSGLRRPDQAPVRSLSAKA